MDQKFCTFIKLPTVELQGVHYPESDDPRLILGTEEGAMVSLSASRLLECLFALEHEGEVPKIGNDWWRLTMNRFHPRIQDVSDSLAGDVDGCLQDCSVEKSDKEDHKGKL